MPTSWLGGSGFPAHTRRGDLSVQFSDQLVKVGGVLSGCGGLVAVLLSFGAQGEPPLLVPGSRVGLNVGLVLEVPPFPALRGPQGPGALRT